ncbi:IS110 family transposase [Vibrio mimicus]|uniref:IS110 family transposase n=1 Tax=Vibrio mimicus TaxID=674 RepID=UPI000AEBC707|nr:transposase [Vibrio mimicus]
MNNSRNKAEVILGVDTHLDIHVGALLNSQGHLLGCLMVTTNISEYERLVTWANSFGCLKRAGVDGTGTYGASLTSVLRKHGVEVFDVNRPDRSKRRSQWKSDPTDAESAARAVLSGSVTAIAKTQSGAAEMMRVVSVARRSTVKAKTQAMNQLRTLLVSAPQNVRERLWKSKLADCAKGCARVRSLGTTELLHTLTTTLCFLAKRWLLLADEVEKLDVMLDALTHQYAHRLREQFGVGSQTAAVLLSTAGNNPERLRNETSLAALCGVNPLPVSSGKTVQHRLNRGGNRAANNAVCTIAIVRMRGEPQIQSYVAHRSAQGLLRKRSSAV